MESIKAKVEGLVDEIQKLEISMLETVEKLDAVIQGFVELDKELNSREETKILWQIEDLEKEEAKLEEKYFEKRGELKKARQELRRKLFDQKDKKDDQKTIMNTLLLSNTLQTSQQTNSPFHQRLQREKTQNIVVQSDDFIVSQWMLSPKDLEYDRSAKPLGSGAFGDVFKGKLRGKDVAIKKLVFQELDDSTMNEFKKECAVMAKLRHPNIILFMGACIAPGNLAMVVELMPKGSVYDRLHDDKIKLGLLTRLMFAKDTALGMACLHGMNPPFLHLDLKSQNLLISDNWTAKVSDFGLSQIKKGKAIGKAGSPLYMAPEMLLDQEYDEKADVYSYGIVLWEIYCQEEPYRGAFKTFEEMTEAVTKKGKRPDIPEDCPEKLKQLMQTCWNPMPQNRLSFQKIVSSKVLDEIIVDAAISKPNDLGRQFWKEKFLEKTVVDWKDFLISFSAKIGFPIPKDPEDIQMMCLKDLIVRKSKEGREEVNIDDFGKMLEWFGPLEKGNSLLKAIELQLRSKGFYGDIETTESEKILNGKKPGTYLVRFSTRDPGFYAITVLSKTNTLKHYRIAHKAGGKYTLGTNDYDSLDALIKTRKKELYLKTPLVGSRYESLFIANDKRVASNGYILQSQIPNMK